jgi:hypothetical protein
MTIRPKSARLRGSARGCHAQKMKKLKLREAAAAGLVLACVLAGGTQAKAQEQGYWRAASTNATAITGDITIDGSKVTIDFFVFPLAAIRKLKPVEVSSVFDADVNAGIEGMLYRLKVAPGQRFQHKNTLCGDEETQWMATYVTGHTLSVAFFSGDEEPVFTFDAMQGAATKCGVFTYAR